MVLFGIVVLSFAIVELLETFAKGAQNINLPLAQTFGVIIAPIVIMAIMAILAYFDLIKIKIAYALTIFIFISFLFIWIISSFIFSSWLYSLIPAFGFALMVCYMAIDWWLISRYNKAFNATVSNEATKKEFMKLTIYFGFKLAYDYLWALIYLVKLIRLAKNSEQKTRTRLNVLVFNFSSLFLCFFSQSVNHFPKLVSRLVWSFCT
nr:hypothetical protein [Mycoplasmopsis bovis]QUE42848.1 hypothetical protein HYD84_00075 [Mycoplasmopsis bovis]